MKMAYEVNKNTIIGDILDHDFDASSTEVRA